MAQPIQLTIPTTTTVLSARLWMPASAAGLLVALEGPSQGELGAHVAQRGGSSGLAVVSSDLFPGGSEASLDHERVQRDIMHVLGQRLAILTRWLRDQRALARLPIAYFASGLAAGAACAAAVTCRDTVSCVVSWQGRIDLVGRDLLQRVRCPTLLLVSDGDPELLSATRAACAQLGGNLSTKILSCSSAAPGEPFGAAAAGYALPWMLKRLYARSAPHHAAAAR